MSCYKSQNLSTFNLSLTWRPSDTRFFCFTHDLYGFMNIRLVTILLWKVLFLQLYISSDALNLSVDFLSSAEHANVCYWEFHHPIMFSMVRERGSLTWIHNVFEAKINSDQKLSTCVYWFERCFITGCSFFVVVRWFPLVYWPDSSVNFSSISICEYGEKLFSVRWLRNWKIETNRSYFNFLRKTFSSVFFNIHPSWCP